MLLSPRHLFDWVFNLVNGTGNGAGSKIFQRKITKGLLILLVHCVPSYPCHPYPSFPPSLPSRAFVVPQGLWLLSRAFVRKVNFSTSNCLSSRSIPTIAKRLRSTPPPCNPRSLPNLGVSSFFAQLSGVERRRPEDAIAGGGHTGGSLNKFHSDRGRCVKNTCGVGSDQARMSVLRVGGGGIDVVQGLGSGSRCLLPAAKRFRLANYSIVALLTAAAAFCCGVRNRPEDCCTADIYTVIHIHTSCLVLFCLYLCSGCGGAADSAVNFLKQLRTA